MVVVPMVMELMGTVPMVMEVTDQLHPWDVELQEDAETEPQNSCHEPGLTISSQRKEQGGKKSPSLLISSP